MEQFEHIDVVRAKHLLDEKGALLADIRDPASYANSYVEGSMHLTQQTLNDLLDQHDPDQPVIVMCYHGHSSQGAAQYLIGQGFDEVYSLDGGFDAWAQVYPVKGNNGCSK